MGKDESTYRHDGLIIKNDETERHIERSLSDVFQAMFNLRLVAAESALRDNEDAIVAAHTVLKREKTEICISLHLLRRTAVLVADGAGMNLGQGLPEEVAQDIGCEIVNIIGNRLRTFFSDKENVYFDMSLPTPGEFDASQYPERILDLSFQVAPCALVELSLHCGHGGAATLGCVGTLEFGERNWENRHTTH